MSRIFAIATIIAGAAAIAALSQPEAEGCAGVRHVDGSSISIAQESAIIVWDPVKKVQHFIRRATFDTKSPDFGFLVPTPTMPKLAPVEDEIFGAMDQWILPRTVEQTRLDFKPLMCMFGCGMPASESLEKKADAPAGVQVLHEQKVGGFDVSVLEADNAEALAKWIKDHGYSADPELYDWLKPYVASKWKISAFKITQDPKSGQLATTKAVRMSFQTDRPFFPYREPEARKDDKDTRGPGRRLLRVFFVGDTRMEGKLGVGAWPAVVQWADVFTDEQRVQLAKETGVSAEEIPAKAWLTTFEDRSSPRPGKDEVYFDPAAERTPIRPPDFIKYTDVWIPLDCVLAGLFLVGLVATPIVLKLIRRKRA